MSKWLGTLWCLSTKEVEAASSPAADEEEPDEGDDGAGKERGDAVDGMNLSEDDGQEGNSEGSSEEEENEDETDEETESNDDELIPLYVHLPELSFPCSEDVTRVGGIRRNEPRNFDELQLLIAGATFSGIDRFNFDTSRMGSLKTEFRSDGIGPDDEIIEHSPGPDDNGRIYVQDYATFDDFMRNLSYIVRYY